ncbi:MAG: DegT/DnrJ/EryC1/StrS family aminotransferase [Proteobacteria bacterium]|nr:DegT/DnrJ/EryC1/StrS family aminotransferase [Pseudomonadota bacterium]
MLQICNLSEKIARFKPAIESTLNRVLNSGWVILGPEVKTFEESFAAYLGTEYCVSLANGTDAIELGLKALGILSNDKVATVANAGMYTSTALLAIGAKPHFMDVDFQTRCATLNEVAKAIEQGVKAIVITHLYGLITPEIEQISALCRKNNIPLLEDCAQAAGAMLNNKAAGSFGDIASFSFYPTKNLGALGDGGAVVTSNPNYAEKVRLLRQYGWTSKYQVGLANARNSRLDEMQAALLSLFLTTLNDDNQRRRQIADRYSKEIKHPNIRMPQSIIGTNYIAHLFVIETAQRAELKAYLQQAGIASDIHYPIPDYKQPVFNNQFSDVYLANTEALAEQILTLPCYPELKNEQIDHIINSINSWSL